MALLRFGSIWDNLITLAVIGFVFYMIYSKLKAGATKDAVTNLYGRFKFGEKNGK